VSVSISLNLTFCTRSRARTTTPADRRRVPYPRLHGRYVGRGNGGGRVRRENTLADLDFRDGIYYPKRNLHVCIPNREFNYGPCIIHRRSRVNDKCTANEKDSVSPPVTIARVRSVRSVTTSSVRISVARCLLYAAPNV